LGSHLYVESTLCHGTASSTSLWIGGQFPERDCRLRDRCIALFAQHHAYFVALDDVIDISELAGYGHWIAGRKVFRKAGRSSRDIRERSLIQAKPDVAVA
jgi:hypothetical protein